ncbi:MAG TPA: hydrogenase maturation protease [Candidatus Binatia bacterium]|nr:hydrogenase maturation protease [Candidatus Binatia bacterium]
MKTVLIGGMGNVLLGDDGVGPYLLRLLASRYAFEKGVEIVDLGTPALDLLHRISKKGSVILIDSIDIGLPPGAVRLFTKQEIIRQGGSARLETHSPALTDTLLGAEFLGVCPEEVVLVGIQVESLEPGCTLSASVESALPRAMTETLHLLNRMGIKCHCRQEPEGSGIWWADAATPKSPLDLRGGAVPTTID